MTNTVGENVEHRIEFLLKEQMANLAHSAAAAAVASRTLVCVLALLADALVEDYDRSTYLSPKSCTTERDPHT